MDSRRPDFRYIPIFVGHTHSNVQNVTYYYFNLLLFLNTKILNQLLLYVGDGRLVLVAMSLPSVGRWAMQLPMPDILSYYKLLIDYSSTSGVASFGVEISVCRRIGHGDAICVRRPKDSHCISGHTLVPSWIWSLKNSNLSTHWSMCTWKSDCKAIQ